MPSSAPAAPPDFRPGFHFDRCSVEVFVNDGEVVLTELIFPDGDIESVAVYAVDGSVDLLSFDLWQLA